jgi:hypothetical protein
MTALDPGRPDLALQPEAAPSGPARTRWFARKDRQAVQSEGWFAAALVSPALLVILLIVFLPLVYSIWLSFAEVDLLRPGGTAITLFGMRLPLYRFTGLANYSRSCPTRSTGRHCCAPSISSRSL